MRDYNKLRAWVKAREERNLILYGNRRPHRTPENRAWENMKQRCYNPGYIRYRNYGGRGITVYEPWIKDFKLFLSHVGKRPGTNYSLDRIDNNGNYEPGNVKWSTLREQVINRGKIPPNSNPFRGITIAPNRFYVSLIVKKPDKKVVYLGGYETLEEAISMRLTAEDEYGY